MKCSCGNPGTIRLEYRKRSSRGLATVTERPMCRREADRAASMILARNDAYHGFIKARVA